MADGTQATKVTLIGITDPKGFIPSFNLKTVAMKSMTSLFYKFFVMFLLYLSYFSRFTGINDFRIGASLLCNMQTYLYNQQSKSVQSG